uniref:TPR-like protein n=1 Tax=Mycena chlorophos TaxID=658473 RepID=A0ABQ0M4I9_MYCCL|nr:TPR-like protein [Mycena chlorophos]
MGNLANSYQNLGKHAEAAGLGQKVLERQTVILGPDHPATLWTMGNLASSYKHLGKYTEAEQLYHLVIRKQIAVLGQDHPDVTRTKDALANLQEQMQEASP